MRVGSEDEGLGGRVGRWAQCRCGWMGGLSKGKQAFSCLLLIDCIWDR